MNKFIVLVVLVAVCAVAEAGLRDRLAPSRELTVTPFPHTFTAKLTRTQLRPRMITILWFGFSTWGFPRYRVQFFENDADGTSRFKFRFGLLHIAEYNDVTPDFSRANVLAGRGIRLIGRGPEWSNIAYTNADANGVRTATTILTDPRGVVTIKAKVAPRNVQDGNATLAPNKIKFDLSISNFQYASNTSKIAVLAVMTLKTVYNPRQRTGADSPGNADGLDEVDLGDSGSGDGGRFAWIRQAWDTTRNRAVNVRAFTLRDDDTDYTGANTNTAGDVGDDDKDVNEASKLVVFLFDTDGQPNNLLWDPEIAMDDNASGRVTASIAVVLLTVLAGFFGKLAL